MEGLAATVTIRSEPHLPMAKKRTPQTFEKRKRERDKQLKREAKQADRLARSAAKREGGGDGEAFEVAEHPDRVLDRERREQEAAEKRARERAKDD